MAKDVKDDLAEFRSQQADSLRATEVSLDEKQAARDAEVLSSVHQKLAVVRKEVTTLVDELQRSNGEALASSESRATKFTSAELVLARQNITEEISIANRATYDALMAELRQRT